MIGLFCYFKPTDHITLNNCLPALQTYTQYGSYVDGTVRVWDSHAIGASSPYRYYDGESAYFPTYSMSDHGDSYLDIHVRIRADGWILAWMLRSDDRGKILWWSNGSTIPRDLPTPTSYGNRLGRAIQIIMSIAGIGGFAWTSLQYYDYEYTGAHRLYFFGKSQSSDGSANAYYYVTVPNGVTVYKAFLDWIVRMGVKPYNATGVMRCLGALDGATKYNHEYSYGATFSYCFIAGTDITSVLQVTGVQHTFQINLLDTRDGGTYWRTKRHAQAVLVWTS